MWKLLNLLPGRRRRMERELERELRYHIDRRIDDLRRRGLSEADARRQVALEFGGVTQIREEVRDTWLWRWLDDGRRDLQYAGRRAATESGVRGHRAAVDRVGHRRQRGRLLAGRSGRAAPLAGDRARAPGVFQLEGLDAVDGLWLRLPELLSALPRAPGTAARLRRRLLPASHHGHALDRASSAIRCAPRSCRARISASSACSRSSDG